MLTDTRWTDAAGFDVLALEGSPFVMLALLHVFRMHGNAWTFPWMLHINALKAPYNTQHN